MDSASVFAFTCPVKTNSGNKALENLPVELANLNAVKPIIITSMETAGRQAIQTLTNAFGDSGMTLGLFDGITGTANLSLIEDLKSPAWKNNMTPLLPWAEAWWWTRPRY